MDLAMNISGILLDSLGLAPFSWGLGARDVVTTVPSSAQIIDQRSFNVLENVPPANESNGTSPFIWSAVTEDSLAEKPFHIYDDEFYDVIGSDPTLTLIATSDTDPIFHEAVVWYPPTDEVFFVQHAGDPAAGTGLEKSAIIQKIALSEAEAVKNSNKSGQVTITVVLSTPQVINPNGGTNYKGQMLFTGEGQGDRIPGTLYLMNPEEPYNTTILVNNYFGRQFNSLNDVAVNPRNQEIYFTDTQYGNFLGFRPAPGMQNQVYRFNDATGAVSVVADGFAVPNGIGFSPDGSYAYVTDTGVQRGEEGYHLSQPASIVQEDGTWENRKLFAYTAAGIPDGVQCDSKGRVYAGCRDGVHVWNASGKLIGKIYTGITAANFQFAGQGRMVIMGETKLFYATLAASGAPLT